MLAIDDKKPLVTVALAMYNVEPFLRECLESVLGQTYRNIEIIAVNDGSPDNSGQIAEDYASSDARIRVIHQENMGLGATRNRAIDEASGSFITFVDSDDHITSDFVEYMVSLALQTGAHIVGSKNCFKTGSLRQVKKEHVRILTPEEAAEEFFYPNIQLGAWNKLYDMAFLKQFDLRFVHELTTGEGLEFITKSALASNCVALGSRKVYFYRLDNPSSATTKGNIVRQGQGALNTMKFIENNLDLSDKRVEKAYKWHLWGCYRYCLSHILKSDSPTEFNDLKRNCIRNLRLMFIDAIFARIRWKHRFVAVCVLISPTLTARFQNLRRGLLLSETRK